jgi:hypothetical protein
MVARTKPLDPETEIMTVREVAKYLRISVSTVYRMPNAVNCRASKSAIGASAAERLTTGCGSAPR